MKYAKITDEVVGKFGTTFVVVYNGDKPICEVAFNWSTNYDGSLEDYSLDYILICGKNNCEPEPDGEAVAVYNIKEAQKINPEITKELMVIAESEFLKTHKRIS